MTETNTVVETCATQSVGDKMADTVSKQAAEGQAFFKQALAWLTENGLDVLLNIVAAILILIVGGLIVKGVVAAVRKALHEIQGAEQTHGEMIYQYMARNGMYQAQ